MFSSDRPFLLLRARARDEATARFTEWYLTEHLRDVRKIPGVVDVLTGHTSKGTRLGWYFFESGEVVQPALSSPQAAFARGAWQRWAPDLEELGIELYGALFPLPLYHTPG